MMNQFDKLTSVKLSIINIFFFVFKGTSEFDPRGKFPQEY